MAASSVWGGPCGGSRSQDSRNGGGKRGAFEAFWGISPVVDCSRAATDGGARELA